MIRALIIILVRYDTSSSHVVPDVLEVFFFFRFSYFFNNYDRLFILQNVGYYLLWFTSKISTPREQDNNFNDRLQNLETHLTRYHVLENLFVFSIIPVSNGLLVRIIGHWPTSYGLVVAFLRLLHFYLSLCDSYINFINRKLNILQHLT